jgi:hypothetical protein
MKEENATNENKPQTEQVDTTVGFNISGHILIRDKESGEEIVNKRNAIHYGNLGYLIANSIGKGTGGGVETNDYVHFMAFGNGASSVDSTGRVLYKSTNTSETRETDATLYRKTYAKVVSNTDANPDAEKPNNKIEIIEGAGFTDLKVTCTLGLGEPAGQDNFDTSSNNEGDFIFDELGLMTYTAGDNATTASSSSELLTHVVFHPVQKSANRIIEVVYTLRIQMT